MFTRNALARACVHACVSACVRACVCACVICKSSRLETRQDATRPPIALSRVSGARALDAIDGACANVRVWAHVQASRDTRQDNGLRPPWEDAPSLPDINDVLTTWHSVRTVANSNGTWTTRATRITWSKRMTWTKRTTLTCFGVSVLS